MTATAPTSRQHHLPAARRLLAGVALLALLTAMLATSTVGVAHAAQETGGGVGAWPASLRVESGFRGTHVDRTLGLINGEDAVQVFDLRATDEIASWVTFHEDEDGPAIREVAVDADSNRRIIVRIAIPEDARNRQFGGSLRATTLTSDESDDTQQDIRLGVDIGVLVNVVGDQVLAGEFLLVDARATEVGLPLRIETTLHNQGNVTVQPELHYVIRYRGDVTAELDGGLEAIEVDQTETILQSWETSEERPGPYTVEVHAAWEGLDLGTKQASFELHPRGTLTRQGEFTSLELVNEPDVGGIAQVRAVFQNTGEIEARVQFTGLLELDGELVGVVETPLKLVYAGDQDALDIFLDVPERGTYRLTGTLNFEGKETAEQAIDIAVPFRAPPPVPLLVAIAAAVVLLTAALVLLVARRNRRRDDHDHEPAGGKRQLVSVGDR